MNIQTIGSLAHNLLRQGQTADVSGTSRRGLYLHLESGWVVYLSSENWRGPLTLNLADTPDWPTQLPVGAGGLVQQDCIAFDRSDLVLEFNQARVWNPPARTLPALPFAQRRETIKQVLLQAQRTRPSARLAALQAVMNGSGADRLSAGEAALYFPYLVQIADQARAGISAYQLVGLLGLGSGLTPSGDDILLGMLLALSRWRETLAWGLDPADFSREILALAQLRTTTLSANLLECAAQGQADERLVLALDGLVTGGLETETIYSLLADWGNSSGLDALCGMAIVLGS